MSTERKRFAVGDRVAFTAAFVRACGFDKVYADARGTIVEVRDHPPGYCKVRWDVGPWAGEVRGAMASNLCPPFGVGTGWAD